MSGAGSIDALLRAIVDDPFDNPASWDVITVGNQVWTGKIEIRGSSRWYRWQKKVARGQEGATNTYQGDKPDPFEIEFFIWTAEQYTKWISFMPVFKYFGVKGDVVPIKVYHPALALVNITAIVCDRIGAVEPRGEDKLYSVKVRVHEYVPAKPGNATATPVAALPTTTVIPKKDVGAGASPVSAVLPTQQEAASNQAAALGIKTALPF